jgi:hypothetical protein
VPEAGPWPVDAEERRRVRQMESEGSEFLAYRDDAGTQHLVRLSPDAGEIVVGRRETSDIPLPWDERVSRTHASIERLGDDWVVVDEGLSRNGTFLNGERVQGRRLLREGDILRVGRTPLLFRAPQGLGADPTLGDSFSGGMTAAELSPSQKRIVAALCRPLATSEGIAAPATNEAIAAEVHLSVDAVKAHLRAIFRKLGIEGLPQNQKRTRLAAIGVAWGLGRERPQPARD